MNLRLETLTLQCRRSREVIHFSRQLSFFHGEIGAGKSSIARLIDFCLGGRLENTQAIRKELVSVELVAQIGDAQAVFEREASGSNQVRVNWKRESGEHAQVLAPLKASSTPIWGEAIFNLSDPKIPRIKD